MPNAVLKQMNSNDHDPQDKRSFVQAQILDAAHQLACGAPRDAELLIEPFLTIAYAYATPEERLAHLFARSIQSRMNAHIQQPRGQNASLDLVSQAFAACTPFATFGIASANAAMLRSLMGAERAVIVDLALRDAVQWRTLLDMLAANPLGPRQIALVGMVSPHAQGRDGHITSSIMSRAKQLDINLTIDPIPPSDDAALIKTARARCHPAGTALVVNAVEAMYQTPASDSASTPNQKRDMILRDLAALRPRLLALVEPDVEHNALPFSARICASWRYHTAIFETLHTCFPLSSPERIAIEQNLFGPKIHNVVVAEHAERHERHERWRAWLRRLEARGFQQLSVEHHQYYVNKATHLRTPLGIHAEDGALMLKWGDIPMMTASAWTI